MSSYFYDANGDKLTYTLPNQIDRTTLTLHGFSFSTLTNVLTGTFKVKTVIANIMIQGTDVYGSYDTMYLTIYAVDSTP